MEEMAVSPAATPVESFTPVEPAAPVSAPETPAAAPETPAVNNADVQASTEGRSDFREADQKPPVDLNGGAARNILPTGSSPIGNSASVTVSNTLNERENKDLGLTGKIINSTTVLANSSQSATAGENGPTAVNKNSVTVLNNTAANLTLSNGTLSVNQSVAGGGSANVTTSVPVNAQGGTDPRDPDKMAIGAKTTLTLGADSSVTQGVEGRVGALGLGSSETRTATGSLSASVERVDENTMRVSTGPKGEVKTEDALNANLRLGSGQVGATLSADRRNSQTDLQTRDFDLRNPAAREAYQKFVSGNGTLPDANAEQGITGSSSTTLTTTHDNKAAIDARLGPLAGKVTVPLSNADGTIKVTNNADGSTQLDHKFTFNNQNMSLTRTFNADGTEDPSKRRYDFMFNNAEPTTAGRLAMGASNNAAFENAIQRRGAQDVQLSFTQADMDKLRLQAGAHPYSQDQNSFIGRLARADDPGKVFNTFTDSRRGAVEQLGQLANRTGQAIPGQAFFLDRNNGQTWRFDQPVARANGRTLW